MTPDAGDGSLFSADDCGSNEGQENVGKLDSGFEQVVHRGCDGTREHDFKSWPAQRKQLLYCTHAAM